LKNEVMFKVNDAFVKFGPELIKEIRKKGGEVFLDLKFHDIPNTVSNYAKAAAELDVFVFNVHCLGGSEMIKKAKESLDEYCEEKNLRKPLIVGVTILTSMEENTLKEELKTDLSIEEMVKHLALLAKKAGLDGVVCSPKEIELIKKACGKEFLCITPGIRPEYAYSDDQKRILTPKQAVKKGANFLVIGRPIIQSEKYGMKRVEAVKKIMEEII
ncbi:MAG: orotidine-5'-phosphate decarboxylase, partial [Candidatus Diapherotrites archaeon CG10_big_fil_rev_8_21_14_0_10_31_34]